MKLHIGNVARSVTDSELTDLIAPIAKPTSVEIIRDQAGVSKGFGFAEFPSDDEAQAVIKGINGHNLGGQELKVAPAKPRKADAARA